MPWYYRARAAINAALPLLAPTQKANLALLVLLVSAILQKRTLCLSELARAYPTPRRRRVAVPKHDLLHRLKRLWQRLWQRLWRFTNNERVDALAVQATFVPHTGARLGFPRLGFPRLGFARLLGLAVDWTMFDTILPSGERVRYQVLRVAVPRKGRALPLPQLAYDRDLAKPPPPERSQNQLEQDALLTVVEALPSGIRPVVLADRGFRRGPGS